MKIGVEILPKKSYDIFHHVKSLLYIKTTANYSN